jgi:hypothetical protein
MTPLYTAYNFSEALSNQYLPLKCEHCSHTFEAKKKDIQRAIKNPKRNKRYCSVRCYRDARTTYPSSAVTCSNCLIVFTKKGREIKKTDRNFCTRSCNASFYNKRKEYGTRRSKLEQWLENSLKYIYPTTEFLFNNKDAITSELDIYIPSLNLAFELNGIFHYEPIYGINKLEQIKENDVSKSRACHEAKIDLCIINTSKQKKFTIKSSYKYLDIISNIINQRTIG